MSTESPRTVDGDVDGEPIDARPREVLAFDDAVEGASTSWTRADPTDALIERWGRYGFLVTLPDGDAHFCAVGRRETDSGDVEHIGWCRCKGFRFHDGPCAHLCTVRKADWSNRNLGMDVLDVEGDLVTIERAVEADVEQDAETEHTAAQATGEVMDTTDAADQARSDHTGRLSELTKCQREVYLAVEHRDVPPVEYAARTNRAPSTVRVHLHRARGKLDELPDAQEADR